MTMRERPIQRPEQRKCKIDEEDLKSDRHRGERAERYADGRNDEIRAAKVAAKAMPRSRVGWPPIMKSHGVAN